MNPDEVKKLVEQGLPSVQVTCNGDGSHFELIVIGDCFEAKTPVQQQKMVYATLSDQITSGAIHAVSIKAYTPEKWEKAKKMQIGSA